MRYGRAASCDDDGSPASRGGPFSAESGTGTAVEDAAQDTAVRIQRCESAWSYFFAAVVADSVQITVQTGQFYRAEGHFRLKKYLYHT